nr:MAG TPA: hypothetical protein [Caudoviricetes sp.]
MIVVKLCSLPGDKVEAAKIFIPEKVYTFIFR